MNIWMKLGAPLSRKAGVRVGVDHQQCLLYESGNEISLHCTLERVTYCFPKMESMWYDLLQFRDRYSAMAWLGTETALGSTLRCLLPVSYFHLEKCHFSLLLTGAICNLFHLVTHID